MCVCVVGWVVRGMVGWLTEILGNVAKWPVGLAGSGVFWELLDADGEETGEEGHGKLSGWTC
jgi:hypothetical protein